MKMPLFYGYARVSTSLQSLQNQRHEIFEYAHKNNILIDKIVEIEISSTKNKKERLIDETLSKLTRGDVLIVTKLDRLGRSTIEVLQIIEDIKSKGIILHIIKDGLIINCNISNPINDMLLTLLSGFAQMEKNFISERTKSALAELKRKGVKLGSPQNLNEEARQKGLEVRQQKARENNNTKKASILISSLRQKGLSFQKIADTLNDYGYKTSTNCKFTKVQVRRIFIMNK